MIVQSNTIKLPLPPAQLLDYLRAITTQPYRPLTQGYTYSHELQGLPDFRLIEGVAVPPHNDGIEAYRPILMLHNPSNNYIVRGVGQNILPQKAGDVFVLGIGSSHAVASKDPNADYGPWSGLVWGMRGEPFAKAEWGPEEVLYQMAGVVVGLAAKVAREYAHG